MGMLSRYQKLGSLSCVPYWDATTIRSPSHNFTMLFYSDSSQKKKYPQVIHFWHVYLGVVPQSRNTAISAFAVCMKEAFVGMFFSQDIHIQTQLLSCKKVKAKVYSIECILSLQCINGILSPFLAQVKNRNTMCFCFWCGDAFKISEAWHSSMCAILRCYNHHTSITQFHHAVLLRLKSK